MTLSNHSPSRDWLKSVKTIRARTKIKHWFKQIDREKNIRLGREMCDKGFKKSNLNFTKLIKESRFFDQLKKEGIKSIDDLLEAIGRGIKTDGLFAAIISEVMFVPDLDTTISASLKYL